MELSNVIISQTFKTRGNPTGIEARTLPLPLFLKMVYHGPKAMEELVHYDPHLVVGILGGSAGTTYDAFKLLSEAKKYGARIALFGRKINNAENQLAFIRFLRLIADGEISAEEAVRAYHGVLQQLGIKPLRSLDDAGLEQVSRSGLLSLSLVEMRTIREHFREPERNRQIRLFLSLPVPQLSNGERREQRRVSGQHPEVPIGARDLDLVNVLADEQAIRRHDVEVDLGRQRHQPFIVAAFSIASSIVPTM